MFGVASGDSRSRRRNQAGGNQIAFGRVGNIGQPHSGPIGTFRGGVFRLQPFLRGIGRREERDPILRQQPGILGVRAIRVSMTADDDPFRRRSELFQLVGRSRKIDEAVRARWNGGMPSALQFGSRLASDWTFKPGDGKVHFFAQCCRLQEKNSHISLSTRSSSSGSTSFPCRTGCSRGSSECRSQHREREKSPLRCTFHVYVFRADSPCSMRT